MRLAVTAIAITLAMLSPALAQTQNWQKFQPADIGFSVEMPDKPELKSQDVNGRPAFSAVVAIDKSVAGADLVFLIKYQSTDKKPGPETEALLDNVVKSVAEGGKVLADKKEVIGSFPARRFATQDSDKDTWEFRDVITDRYFIQAIFLGPTGNPLGKRFLDSLALVKP